MKVPSNTHTKGYHELFSSYHDRTRTTRSSDEPSLVRPAASLGRNPSTISQERRHLLAVPVPDRWPGTVGAAVETSMDQHPLGVFESITVDRGKEFACFPAMQARGLPTYFADPYAIWQREINENTNGLLREFYPRGMDLARLSRQELAYLIGLFHRRP